VRQPVDYLWARAGEWYRIRVAVLSPRARFTPVSSFLRFGGLNPEVCLSSAMAGLSGPAGQVETATDLNGFFASRNDT
jgi:hypothetical protein